MNYLLDTVVLIRYLAALGEITPKVKIILENAGKKNNFFVSVVSLMEVLYLTEKHRITISVEQIIKLIEESAYFYFVDLSPEVILMAKSMDFHELHDRMILATAKYHDIPVISSDKQFKNVKDIKVIW